MINKFQVNSKLHVQLHKAKVQHQVQKIAVNTSPNKKELKTVQRSVTPNSQTKRQILSSNYGYSTTNKQQNTPKRINNSNVSPKDQIQERKKRQISEGRQNQQSKILQQGDENCQISHPSNKLEQQSIQKNHSQTRSKAEQNFSKLQSNKNRSESPLYINVNDIQSKYGVQRQSGGSLSVNKNIYAQNSINQNNSNTNLKATQVNSQTHTTPIQEYNLVPQIFKQQQKSQSYTNLPQQRMSSQDFQSSSQNSVQTLQVEKVSHFSSQSQIQIGSCQESTNLQMQRPQENQISQIKQVNDLQRQDSKQNNVLSSITNFSNNKLINDNLNQNVQAKKQLNNQQLNQTSHFQNDTACSFLEKEEALMKINSISSNKLQNNNSFEQQQKKLLDNQQEGQQQLEQLTNEQEEENMKNSSKINDTIFHHQKSSMFSCQHEEMNNISLFKQQQFSPIIREQFDSQYFDNQLSPQSPSNNTNPSPFICPNTQTKIIQQNEIQQQIQYPIEQNQKINNQQFNIIYQNHQQSKQQQSYQQQSFYQQSQLTDEIQNVSSYYINNNQLINQIQNNFINKSQTFESQQDNQLIQKQSYFLNSQYIEQQNNQSKQFTQQVKNEQNMPHSGDIINNRSLNESQKSNNRNMLVNDSKNFQNQNQIEQDQFKLNNSQQNNLQNDKISLPYTPKNYQIQNKNQQEQFMIEQQCNQQYSGSNDNQLQNSQFSFTPNILNKNDQQYQIQQEQVKVFNNPIHDNFQMMEQQQQFIQQNDQYNIQNQQNNISQSSIKTSLRQSSIKQLNIQNSDLPLPHQKQQNTQDNSSDNIINNQIISTNNSNIKLNKPEYQNISPPLQQENIQNQTQINKQNSEQNKNEELLQSSQNSKEIQQQQIDQQCNKNQSNNSPQNQGENFYDSNIFNQQLFNNPECIKILPANIQKTKLLYRLTEDGQQSQIFHRKCDGQGPTITFVKANGDHIFGYYLPISFCRSDQYSTTDKCFIFTLQNSLNIQPTRFEIKPEKKFISIYQNSKNPCLGSTLNGKQDLIINFDNLEKSCSNIGHAYKIDSNIQGDKILAGQYSDWNISEIEIFGLTF